MAQIDLLSDKQVRALKPLKKPYKLTDGRALHLLVTPAGGKLWRLKYRINGKEKLAALGRFPDVSVAEARAKRDDARKLIAKNVDPVARKREQKETKGEQSKFTFTTAAERYFDHNKNAWSSTHQRDVRRIIDELTESLGDKAMAAITHEDVQAVMAGIEKRGALNYARDCRLYFRAIVKHFNAENRKHRIVDPSADIVITKPKKVVHHPALDPSEVGPFLRKLQVSPATAQVRIATKLLMLTAVRTNELRKAAWSEIDSKAKLWRIPATRMKSGAEHTVPLSAQALELLATLRTLTGEYNLMFPNLLDPKEPMSDGAILANLGRMGYRGKATGHGMRGTFSTWCNENSFSGDAIERQLSHAPRDETRAAYLHSKFLPERKRMMTAWADFLEQEERTNVVQLKGAK